MTTVRSNAYSKFGYLGVKKETTANTLVRPDVFAELMSESLQVNWNKQMVQTIAGRASKNMRNVMDTIGVEGEVTILVDAKTLGYFLNCFFGTPTTTTVAAGKVYKHEFNVQQAIQTYTFEIQRGDDQFVTRYGGVRIQSLSWSQNENKIQISMNVIAQSAFTNARLTAAAANATALSVDQSKGMLASDILLFLDADDEATIVDTASVTSVDSELAITMAAGITASADDIVVVEAQTPSYDISENMTWIGGASYKVGDDIDNTAITNAEDFSVEVTRDQDQRFAAKGCKIADRFPAAIIAGGIEMKGTLNKYYDKLDFLDDVRGNDHKAIRIDFCGKQIDTNSAVAATGSFLSGASGVALTASTAGFNGNDLNVTIITNSTDTLAASKSGNNILVSLASTTTTSNTATLVAAAIDALSDITAAASGAGTGQVAPVAKFNLGGGRDANEEEKLRIDLPDVRFETFANSMENDGVINQEIPFTAFVDKTESTDCRVTLINSVSAY